jgi:hypothetical protein
LGVNTGATLAAGLTLAIGAWLLGRLLPGQHFIGHMLYWLGILLGIAVIAIYAVLR